MIQLRLNIDRNALKFGILILKKKKMHYFKQIALYRSCIFNFKI